MGFTTYLVLLFLSGLLLLNPSDSKCQKPFKCGNFSMDFPLSDINDVGCGMVKVDGCNSTSEPPRILPKEGYGYHILENISQYKFRVKDSELKTFMKNCYALRNISLPESPSISFLFSPNLTFFSCYNTSNDTHQFDDHFKSYSKQECTISRLYYNASSNVDPPTDVISNIPYGCTITQLPLNSSKSSGALFDRLTYEFILELRVSEACYSCFHGGGQCLTDNQNKFYCKKGKSRLKLILFISISGVGLLLLLSVSYIIWLRKKRSCRDYTLSRNISSNPSSKSDIDVGSSFFGIPVFSYTELEEATDNFDSSNELGDGGFGTVYRGKLRDGREVAIKRLYEHNYKRVEQFLNEIKILTSLRHPNLVSLYGCTSRRSRELLLVYEFIANGTVADHLHGEKAKEAPLIWPLRMSIAIETASALSYLHRSDIIHRDVKTDNILLDINFCVKVADFGISRLFPNDVTHISTAPQGTPGYVDPEYHQCYQLTDKSDVYSFGVVLIELISSMPAVDVSRHRHEINLANLALNRIQRSAFDELIDPSLGYESDPEVMRMTTTVAELAFRCLQAEKDLRPSMDEVLVVLKDIQGGEDYKFEHIKEANGGNHINPVKILPSPETDDFVLLNNKSSSSTVTDKWVSSGYTTSSSTV